MASIDVEIVTVGSSNSNVGEITAVEYFRPRAEFDYYVFVEIRHVHRCRVSKHFQVGQDAMPPGPNRPDKLILHSISNQVIELPPGELEHWFQACDTMKQRVFSSNTTCGQVHFMASFIIGVVQIAEELRVTMANLSYVVLCYESKEEAYQEFTRLVQLQRHITGIHKLYPDRS